MIPLKKNQAFIQNNHDFIYIFRWNNEDDSSFHRKKIEESFPESLSVPASVEQQPDLRWFVFEWTAELTSVPSATGELQLAGRGLNWPLQGDNTAHHSAASIRFNSTYKHAQFHTKLNWIHSNMNLIKMFEAE